MLSSLIALIVLSLAPRGPSGSLSLLVYPRDRFWAHCFASWYKLPAAVMWPTAPAVCWWHTYKSMSTVMQLMWWPHLGWCALLFISLLDSWPQIVYFWHPKPSWFDLGVADSWLVLTYTCWKRLSSCCLTANWFDIWPRTQFFAVILILISKLL